MVLSSLIQMSWFFRGLNILNIFSNNYFLPQAAHPECINKYRIKNMKSKSKSSNVVCPQRDCIVKVGKRSDDRPIQSFLNERAIENEVTKRNRIRARRAALLRQQMQRESSTMRFHKFNLALQINNI